MGGRIGNRKTKEALGPSLVELDKAGIDWSVLRSNRHMVLELRLGDHSTTQVIPKTTSDLRAAKNLRASVRQKIKELQHGMHG